MGWGSIIKTGLEIGSSLFGAHESGKASDAQQQAAQQGIDFSKAVYGDAQGNFQPYMQAGNFGTSGLMALMGGDNSGWMNSPDRLASRDAGLYAMDHSAAARGRLNSGGYAMDAAKGLADIDAGYLGNYRNSLFGLAGMGQQAAGTLGQIGTNASSQINQQYNNIGNAQASAYGANAGAGYGIANTLGNYFGGKPATTASTYAPSSPTPSNVWNPYGRPAP